jgi:hypothetical protein
VSHKKFLAYSFLYLLGLATMGLYIKGFGYFYFKYYQSEFDKSYISCSEAISADRLIKDKSTDVDRRLIDNSTSVMKLACLDAKKITNHLLEVGVSDKLIRSHIGDLMATPQGRALELNKPSIFDE